MKKDEHISDEQLNAFVDGELDSEEGNCLFDAAEQSSELDQRLCQQRKLKELVKHAYRDVPEPPHRLSAPQSRKGVFSLAVAASALLFLGLIAGMAIEEFIDYGQEAHQTATPGSQQAVADVDNYILHIVSGEPAQMKRALQQAQALLSNAEPGRPRQVEVVANEQGLDLLRSDVTPFSDEIRVLARENVVFYACSKAIQRLEEKGVEVRLVPEAVPGYTALDRVVSRMQEGWHYIKI